MRQGRRDEARAIAERARGAAIYNLYSDPMMLEVVENGQSSVLLWERAKAFYDNGNYDQAARRLATVVELLPENIEAHQQLAIAYGHIGRVGASRKHLERVLELDPDQLDAHVRLATVHLEEQRPREALPHLERALQLNADDPDAGWLLARAKVLTGDISGGLATFESAHSKARAAQRDVPAWAHNEWGSALAQSGRPDAALEHFETALAGDPNNAQTLFYSGLASEGLGRHNEAVNFYCRSMKAQANPPAANRLQSLGRSCS